MAVETIIEARQGSVTDADVDVLVNASNTLGRLGSGVSAAIRMACGPEFQETILKALAKRGGAMQPGDVLLTHAGDHPRARFVLHAAVMDYRDAAPQVAPDEARIRRCTERIWNVVEEQLPNAVSIGMVALGAGTGALGERMPTEVACTSLQSHLAARSSTKIKRVVFHGFTWLEYLNISEVVRAHFPNANAPPPVET